MINNYGSWQYANNRMMKQNMPAQYMPTPNMPAPSMPAPTMPAQSVPMPTMPAQSAPMPNKPQKNTMQQNMQNQNVMHPEVIHPNMPPKSKIQLDFYTGAAVKTDHKCKPTLSEALELIKQAVEGETEDRLFYDYLIKNAPSEEDKKIISEIRDNEIGHAKIFRQLYCDLTGKTIPQNKDASFNPPATYCEGLIKALIGETNAVKKYRNILFAMTERKHINMLTEIITDEIRHATLYNLLIHNNDCKY